MPQAIPLEKFAQVTLDASGNGTVSLGPAKFNESWQIDTVSTSVSTNVGAGGIIQEPQFAAYRDNVSQSALIGGTYSGSFDYDNAFNYTVYSGRLIAFQWTGGVPGATASVHLYGTDNFA